jgi:peptidoglycan/LPS O-acetylase OafA/YrhL
VKKLNFLPRIESLRGLAALMVVSYHVSGQFQGSPFSNWLDGYAFQTISAASNGIGAVVVFFVLSGFVLARSLDNNPNALTFLRSRFFRLLPAASTVVALLTVLHWRFGIYVGYEASFDPLEVILNMLMIRSDINGVMWSMTVECVATPLILLSVWLIRWHGALPLWSLIAVLFGLSFWGPYVHLLGGFTNLASMYAFVAGVLLHFRGQRIVSPLSPRAATAAGVLAIALFLYCGMKKQTAPILLLECLSASILVVLIAWRPGFSLFNLLDSGLARFYGRISYSFYLLHPLGILFASRLLDPIVEQSPGLSVSLKVLVTTFLSISLTTPCAWLSWRLIESPFIRLGKRAWLNSSDNIVTENSRLDDGVSATATSRGVRDGNSGSG